MEQALKFSPHN